MAGEKIVQQALKAVRELNPLGLFSRATEEASKIPQAKGTPQQMRAALLKQGVKPDELKWTGFDDWAKGRQSVTRDEVADFLRRNEVRVEESVLGYNPRVASLEARKQEIDREIEAIASREIAAGRVPAEHPQYKALSDEYYDIIDNRMSREVPTKFEKYTLPGGDNYRELLLKRPEVKNDEPVLFSMLGGQGMRRVDPNNYRSSHFDDPNILAHLRLKDRTDPEGRRILHVEEIQSDWAQEGRKRGFAADNANRIADLQKQSSDLIAGRMPNQMSPEEIERLRGISDELVALQRNTGGVPSAPFVESTPKWTDLALKRALREAAEGGYDALAWTPGAQQAKRFDLSQQVSRVAYDPDKRRLWAYDPDGENVIDQGGVTPDKVSDYIGREAAERLLARPRAPYTNASGTPVPGSHFLEGQDLSVGGEGMRGYYDKIVPTQLQKLVRPMDPNAQFGTVSIPGQMRNTADLSGLDEDAARSAYNAGKMQREMIDLPSLNITPAMREKIKEGLPLFTMVPGAVGLGMAQPGQEEPRDGFADGGVILKALRAVRGLPPAENSRLTQIATTGPSYDKALRHLERAGIEGRAIDYGAGRGHGLRSIGADTFEPYPQGWTPTFTKPEDIPDDVYRRLVNLNVLNVLDPEARQSAVLNMGRVVEPGGGGVISTRGRDVMAARGEPGPEPMSLIIGEGDSARYQKGFTPRELREYVGDTLGPRFDVEPSDVGAASIMFRRNREDGGAVDFNDAPNYTLDSDAAFFDMSRVFPPAPAGKIPNRAEDIPLNRSFRPAQPEVVDRALEVVRSEPRPMDIRVSRQSPPPPRPAPVRAPARAPAAPDRSESRRLWEIYNETGNPADFVRASNAMRAGRAEGGRLLEDQYLTHYLPNVGRQVMADGGVPVSEGEKNAQLNDMVAYADRLDRAARMRDVGQALSETWPAQLARSIVGGAALPRDVYEGRVDPTSEIGIQRAMDLSSAVMGGGMTVGSAPRGSIGMFLGPSAKTADLQALEVARDMVKKGATRDEIYDATKWLQGADKQWRFEIPDTAASMRPGYIEKYTVGEAIDHPELFRAYPQLADVDFYANPIKKGGIQGMWSGNPNVKETFPTLQIGKYAKNPLSSALHELQHGVQAMENFAPGGNTLALKKGTPAWAIYQERLAAIKKPLPLETYAAVAGFGNDIEAARKSYPSYLKAVKNPSQLVKTEAQKYAVKTAYLRSAGEVEARNVQTRAQEGYDKRPWETQQFPDEMQIVRERSKERDGGAVEGALHIARGMYADGGETMDPPLTTPDQRLDVIDNYLEDAVDQSLNRGPAMQFNRLPVPSEPHTTPNERIGVLTTYGGDVADQRRYRDAVSAQQPAVDPNRQSYLEAFGPPQTGAGLTPNAPAELPPGEYGRQKLDRIMTGIFGPNARERAVSAAQNLFAPPDPSLPPGEYGRRRLDTLINNLVDPALLGSKATLGVEDIRSGAVLPDRAGVPPAPRDYGTLPSSQSFQSTVAPPAQTPVAKTAEVRGPYGQFSDADVEALANMIAGEASTQGREGMAQVGQVALNRVLMNYNDYGNTLQAQLSRPRQFLGYNSPNAKAIMAGETPQQQAIAQQAREIARGLIEGTIQPKFANATDFNRGSTSFNAKRGAANAARLGSHTFFNASPAYAKRLERAKRERQGRATGGIVDDALGVVRELPQQEPVRVAMFAGEGAVGAPLQSLELAKRLIAEGASPEEAYRGSASDGSTGWFQGADGRWRFEVSDKDATINPENFERLRAGNPVRPSELLSHPRLFEMYPNLNKINLGMVPQSEYDQGLMGSFNNRTNTLSLPPDPKQAQSTMLHELQHGIQNSENFGTGGGSTAIKEALKSEVLLEQMRASRRATEMRKQIMDRMFDTDYADPEQLSKFREFQAENERQIASEQERIPALKQRFEELNPTGRWGSLKNYELYRRLAGETEARNVQNRMQMDLDERRASFPGTTQEYPNEEQYIRMRGERADGGEVESAMNVVRGMYADGGSPAAEKYEAMPGFFSRMLGLSGGSQPEADIQQYENRMRAIAQQPADIQSMTHAPSKPMRPIEIEGGFIGKRQLGEAPYDVAGPLSGMAQTAYSLKTVPFYFTPAAPFAAAADLGEAAIDTKSALDKGDYLGAGVTGALGVVAPALAYRKQAADAVRSGLEAARRFVAGNPGTATAVGAGAAVMTPEEAEAGGSGLVRRGLEAINPIRAWHGSPRKFERFDISRAGSGEGQQLYGKGMYFADDKNRALEFVGDPEDRYRRFSGQMTPKEEIAFDLANRPDARDMDIISALARKYGENISFDEAQSIALDAMKRRGSLYEVDINAPRKKFLNWNRPLSEQSLDVQSVLTPERMGLREALLPGGNYAWVDETGMPVGVISNKMPKKPFLSEFSGNRIYNMIGRNDPDRSTSVLRDLGLSGNLYQDPKSFGLSRPSHNYVVFDPARDVEILNRYADGGSVADRAMMLAREINSSPREETVP